MTHLRPVRFTIVRDLKRAEVARKQLLITVLAAAVHVTATISMVTAVHHHNHKAAKWVAASKGMHNMQRHKRHRKGLGIPFGI